MHRPLALLVFFSAATAASAADGPFTQHFLDHLKKDPKANEFVVDIAFAQHSDEFGSFGGKNNEEEKITHRPVVFIHGNSDYALHRPERTIETGWTKSVQHFKTKGYTGAELYGLTYGSGDVATGAMNNSVKCEYVKTHRYFIESILSYTQAPQVDIIAHSMGVTIARMILQGGTFKLAGSDCELGDSLKGKVRSLVSISGAHYGMCMCLLPALEKAPSCGREGFTAGSRYPDVSGTMQDCMEQKADPEDMIGYSALLQEVNKRSEEKGKEADRIITIFSKDDDVLGANGNLAWGRQTSLMPGSDLIKEFSGLNHFQAKDETASTQFEVVNDN